MPINSSYMRLAGKGALDREEKERRTKGRMPMEGLRCDHGDVVDLSPSGACIRRTGLRHWPIGKQIIVTFKLDDEHLSVRAKVVREIKDGTFSRRYGLHFVDLSPTQSQKVMNLAKACRPHTSVVENPLFR